MAPHTAKCIVLRSNSKGVNVTKKCFSWFNLCLVFSQEEQGKKTSSVSFTMALRHHDPKSIVLLSINQCFQLG